MANFKVGSSQVVGITAKRHLVVHLARLTGRHTGSHHTQAAVTQHFAFAIFSVQQCFAQLLRGCHRHNAFGLPTLAGIIKLQVKITVCRLLIELDVVTVARRCFTCLGCGHISLGTRGYIQCTQLWQVTLSAILNGISGIGTSAGCDGQVFVGQRLAQGALNQQRLVIARGCCAAFALGGGAQRQGFATHGGVYPATNLRNILPHHAARKHNVKCPAHHTVGTRCDQHVVGTKPTLEQGLQLCRLTLGRVCQFKRQIVAPFQGQHHFGSSRLGRIQHPQGLALGFGFANR